MQPFKFQSSAKFIAGPGSIDQLGPETAALGIEKVLIVTDQGIVGAGLLEPVLRSLDAAGIKSTRLDSVEPNPTDETAINGADVAKTSGAQAIVGIGGGSPIDAAKAIAVMATNDGPLNLDLQ